MYYIDKDFPTQLNIRAGKKKKNIDPKLDLILCRIFVLEYRYLWCIHMILLFLIAYIVSQQKNLSEPMSIASCLLTRWIQEESIKETLQLSGFATTLLTQRPLLCFSQITVFSIKCFPLVIQLATKHWKLCRFMSVLQDSLDTSDIQLLQRY